MSNTNVCEHGSLRRQCPHCDVIEAEKRISYLEEENRRLREALHPFAVTADKLDQVRAKAPIMVKEYEASASIVGWRYEDAARARVALSQEEKP